HARLHVGGDQRVAAARGERGAAGHLDLVGDFLHARNPADFRLDLRARGLVGRFASKQHVAVVARGVEVAVAEAVLDAEDLELDVLVLDVHAGGAPVARHEGGGAGPGDGERDAAGQGGEGRGGEGHGGERAFHRFSPKITLSTTSQRQCTARRWISWTRIVRGCSTLRWKSLSRSMRPISPPSRPVSAITRMPRACAERIAAITFFELPEVEMASRKSPAWPRASTCLEKTCS